MLQYFDNIVFNSDNIVPAMLPPPAKRAISGWMQITDCIDGDQPEQECGFWRWNRDLN